MATSSNDTPTEGGPSFELEQSDAYSEYMLYSRTEILFVLRSMAKKNCVMTVYFDHARYFFLTAVIDVDDRSGTLFIDCGSEEAINQLALRSKHLMCTGNLDKIKIQFILDGVKPVQFGGRTVFAAKLPPELLRLQRREYFRLETSQANPIICQARAPRGTVGTVTLNLQMLDISGGGVGLIAPPEADALLPVGTLLTHCRIDLPEEGVVQTDLIVRTAFGITLRNGNTHLRVGCEYVDLPGNRLSMIQRYITRIERERKAKLSSPD